MRKALVLVLLLMIGTAFAYHEFKVPKKAYKKVTIEYFSNEEQITEPCSTVYIYYDKSDVEIYREVKKGCCNPVEPVDSAVIYDLLRAIGDTGVQLDSTIKKSELTPAY